jgi:hypothetical protein
MAKTKLWAVIVGCWRYFLVLKVVFHNEARRQLILPNVPSWWCLLLWLLIWNLFFVRNVLLWRLRGTFGTSTQLEFLTKTVHVVCMIIHWFRIGRELLSWSRRCIDAVTFTLVEALSTTHLACTCCSNSRRFKVRWIWHWLVSNLLIEDLRCRFLKICHHYMLSLHLQQLWIQYWFHRLQPFKLFELFDTRWNAGFHYHFALS